MKQSFQIKSEIQLCFKIVFLGQSSVGKTSLIKQFLKNEFVMKSMSTVGVTCESKIVIVNNQQVKVQLWDTAGQERFRSITKNYYRGCDAVVIVYDVTNMKSFDQVSSWIADFDEYTITSIKSKCERPAIKMLLGNKIDMQTRDVSTELGVAYSKGRKSYSKKSLQKKMLMLNVPFSHTKIESGDKNQRRGSMIETKQIVLEDPFINKSARFYKDVSISDHSKFQVIKSAGDSSQEDIQINNTSNRQLTSPQDNATHTHQQAETPLKLIHPRQSGIIRDEYFRKHSSNQSCMCSC